MTVTGPTDSETGGNIRIDRNLRATVSWDDPVGMSSRPSLSYISHTERFYTWLVAKNLKNGRYMDRDV